MCLYQIKQHKSLVFQVLLGLKILSQRPLYQHLKLAWNASPLEALVYCFAEGFCVLEESIVVPNLYFNSNGTGVPRVVCLPLLL